MRELNAAAVSAGLTGFIWYACGALPLQLALSAALGLSAGSVFIVWATGGAASIVLSLIRSRASQQDRTALQRRATRFVPTNVWKRVRPTTPR